MTQPHIERDEPTDAHQVEAMTGVSTLSDVSDYRLRDDDAFG